MFRILSNASEYRLQEVVMKCNLCQDSPFSVFWCPDVKIFVFEESCRKVLIFKGFYCRLDDKENPQGGSSARMPELVMVGFLWFKLSLEILLNDPYTRQEQNCSGFVNAQNLTFMQAALLAFSKANAQ